MEVKHLRHYRFGGTDYCEAMLCHEDYHFVRCLEGSDTLEESTSESSDSSESVESSESGENGITGESQE